MIPATMDNFIYSLNTFNHLLVRNYSQCDSLTEIIRNASSVSDDQTINAATKFLTKFFKNHQNHKDWLFQTNVLKEIINSYSLLTLHNNLEAMMSLEKFLFALEPSMTPSEKAIVSGDYGLGITLWKKVSECGYSYPMFKNILLIYSTVDGDIHNHPEIIKFHVQFIEKKIVPFLKKPKNFTKRGDIAVVVFSMEYLQGLYSAKKNYHRDLIKLCEVVCQMVPPLLSPVQSITNFSQKKIKFQDDEIVASCFSFLTTVYVVKEAILAINLLNIEWRFWRTLREYLDEPVSSIVMEKVATFVNVVMVQKYYKRMYGFTSINVANFTINCIASLDVSSKKEAKGEGLFILYLKNYMKIQKIIKDDRPNHTMSIGDFEIISSKLIRFISMTKNKLFFEDTQKILEAITIIIEDNGANKSTNLLKQCASMLQEPNKLKLVAEFFLNLQSCEESVSILVAAGCFDSFIKTCIGELSTQITNTNSFPKDMVPPINLIRYILKVCLSRNKITLLRQPLEFVREQHYAESIINNIGKLQNPEDSTELVLFLMELPTTDNANITYTSELYSLGDDPIKQKVTNLITAKIHSVNSSDFLFWQPELLQQMLSTPSSLQLLKEIFYYMNRANTPQYFQLFQQLDLLGTMVSPGLEDPEMVDHALSILGIYVAYPNCHEYVISSGILSKLVISFNVHSWWIEETMASFYQFMLGDGQDAVSPQNLEHLANIDVVATIRGIIAVVDSMNSNATDGVNQLRQSETGLSYFVCLVSTLMHFSDQVRRNVFYNYGTQLNRLIVELLAMHHRVHWDQNTVNILGGLARDVNGGRPVVVNGEFVDIDRLIEECRY
ncbi:hypothetical protein DASC09_005150 [Saccharomycopsis crataegensis]|uniref:Uncharacterized protein n=1 Tax=Saccharomycopsis crataegensis TaxID=43959 RepID=A0AAV5QE17_9ASCO|nr:hypothetical protein DASC09_005150 [Saccharomycopsis crataegensis]